VLVHPADLQDSPGASQLLERIKGALARLALIFGDGAYATRIAEEACAKLNGCRLVVVTRSPEAVGFQVLPRRWVVERTFAWLGRNRRLSKDYEQLTTVSEAFVKLAIIRLMLARLA
jgi:hypothetical protein